MIPEVRLFRRILSTARGKMRISRRVLRDNIEGWLFLSPVVISVLVFTVYPLYQSLRLSFREWNPLGADTYVGLANYRALFSDWVFLLSYKNALYYALLTVPAGLVWGIGLAIALQNVRWRAFFRALYFLPTVTSSSAVAVFWSLIYQPDYGLLNNLLRMVNIKGPNWLGHTDWAMISVSVVVVWMGTGYWMVIFLAGLLDIPQDYLDAAKVDGASFWQGVRYVIIPQLTPTIFYYLTNALITVWVAFDIVYVMTSGGPANATLMPAVHLYKVAWGELRMGYASAIAWAMAIVIFILTALHFGLARRWVHYER
jgi:multiple sugar transport system permease protein